MADENEDITVGEGEILSWDEFLQYLPASDDDLPPAIERLVYDPDTGERSLSDTPGLVDGRGILQTVERRNPDGTVSQVPFYYDLDRDPQAAYNSLSPERRQVILDVMEDRGVPTGTWQQNVRAFELLYSEANRFGKTADVMLADIIEKVPATSKPRRVAPLRVSSSQDLQKIVKDVARSTIGRTVSDEVAQKFAEDIQRQQRDYQKRLSSQSGGVIEEMPDVGVQAEQFVRQIEPTKANAYRFLGYFDQMANSLGSRI